MVEKVYYTRRVTRPEHCTNDAIMVDCPVLYLFLV